LNDDDGLDIIYENKPKNTWKKLFFYLWIRKY
jgi:hypothetical protein